jgi:DNA-binding NarL/FixJ family response regulator
MAIRDLTTRELQVLERVAEGLQNKEIAQQLEVALSTVENHLKAIFVKLAVSNRTEAARVYWREHHPVAR